MHSVGKTLTYADFKLYWFIHRRDHSSMKEDSIHQVGFALQVQLCMCGRRSNRLFLHRVQI